MHIARLLYVGMVMAMAAALPVLIAVLAVHAIVHGRPQIEIALLMATTWLHGIAVARVAIELWQVRP